MSSFNESARTNWQCSGCYHSNRAAATHCSNCLYGRDAYPPHVSVPSTNPNSLRVKPGDWWCYKCHNNNFAKRTECNMCRSPKAEASLDRSKEKQ